MKRVTPPLPSCLTTCPAVQAERVCNRDFIAATPGTRACEPELRIPPAPWTSCGNDFPPRYRRQPEFCSQRYLTPTGSHTLHETTSTRTSWNTPPTQARIRPRHCPHWEEGGGRPLSGRSSRKGDGFLVSGPWGYLRGLFYINFCICRFKVQTRQLTRRAHGSVKVSM